MQLRGERRNSALVGLAASYALIALALAAAFVRPGFATGIPAFLLIGLMQYRLVAAVHEATHRTFLQPPWLNELSGVVHAALVGTNFARHRREHLAHHETRELASDSIAYVYLPILRARPGWRRLAMLVLGTALEAFEKLRQQGVGAGLERDRPAAERRQSLVLLVLHALLFGMFWALFGWWGWLVFWVAPVATVALFVNRVRIFVEHGFRYAGRDQYGRPLGAAPLVTVDLASNPVERFFVAGFWLNYHNAHHHVPSIPHYHVPRLREILEREEPGYPGVIATTYAASLVRMVRGT
jgi:fatty acid desaturase